MKNEMKEYRNNIRNIIAENSADTDWVFIRDEMKERIGFYQQERLVHLIVTMTFAILVMASFAMIWLLNTFALLAAIFLVVEAFYIYHYFFLENTVQEFYRMYYVVRERARKQDNAILK